MLDHDLTALVDDRREACCSRLGILDPGHDQLDSSSDVGRAGPRGDSSGETVPCEHHQVRRDAS